MGQRLQSRHTDKHNKPILQHRIMFPIKNLTPWRDSNRKTTVLAADVIQLRHADKANLTKYVHMYICMYLVALEAWRIEDRCSNHGLSKFF
jgi:hypothetical protein